VFGFALVLLVFGWVVVGGPALLTSFLLSLLIPENLASDPATAGQLTLAIQTLVSLVFRLLYLPLQLTCLTLLYFDLRVRSEGLDLMLTARPEDQAGLPVRDLIATSSRLPSGPVVTGKEIGNFSLLTIVIGGAYLAILFGLAGLVAALIGGATG
jgi:hypothetical protein